MKNTSVKDVAKRKQLREACGVYVVVATIQSSPPQLAKGTRAPEYKKTINSGLPLKGIE